MAVTNTTNKITTAGNGSKTAFDFPFKIFDSSQLAVYTVVAATGVATGPLTLTTNYTVSINSVTEGGTVTYLVAPPAGTNAFIKRIVDYEQEAVIPTEGAFPEEQIENQLDKDVMMIIQINEAVSRCAQLAVTSAITSVTLPDPQDGYALVWNGTTGAIHNVAIDSAALATAVAAAAASATSAAGQVTLAAAQVALATTQATNAAASATTASTQATNAAASAVSAAASAASINLASPAAIGNTTPNTGKFTTLEATTTLKLATTHQGDILYDNGTSLVRLTPGTSGQGLQTQGASANPLWADPTFKFISKTTVAAATNSGDIAITATNYYMVTINLSVLSAADSLSLRFNNDSGSNYTYVNRGFDTGATAANANSAGTTSILLGPSYVITSTARIASYAFHIFPGSTNGATAMVSGRSWGMFNSSTVYGYSDFMGQWNNTTPTSFRIFTNGGANMTADINVYQLKQA